MGGLKRELGLAVRSLGRSPGFAAIVILTMGLGIGANTAVFSVVYGLLLEPLPFEEPEELVWIQNRYLPGGSMGAVSVPEFAEFRAEQPAIDAMSLLGTASVNLTGLETPVRLQGLVVSPGYFEMLGRRPAMGRAFLAEEEEPGRGEVVILSHALWTEAFGADPSLLTRSVRLDGRALTVVGVMGPDFEDLAPRVFPGRGADFWIPATVDPTTFSQSTVERHGYWLVGRLADGASREAAEAGLLEAMRRIEARYPDISNAGSRDVVAIPIRERIAGDTTPTLKLLAVAVGLLLLLTGVNVTNMLIARSETRGSEVAVRAALGAGRDRLLAHGFSESIVIGLAGGILGVGLAVLALGLLPAYSPDLAPPGGATLSVPVLGFALALSLLAGVLAGAVPGIRVARGDVFALLKTDRLRGGGRAWIRSTLVTVQVAGTVVLVSSAGLVLRSLGGLHAVDTGFDATGLAMVEVNAMRSDYSTFESVQRLYGALESRLESVPGVQSVTASWQTPLQSGMSDWPVMGEVGDDPEWLSADPNWVSPSYFDTYGIEVVEGRGFVPADLDREEGPVVVSESVARTLWPGERAVGRRVNVNFPDPQWREVIGVVRDIRGRGLRETPRLQWYMTFAPGPLGPNPNLTLTVKSRLAPNRLQAAVVEALGSVDANVPVGRVETMDSQIADTLLMERTLSLALVFFGLLSLVLGAMGLYGLVSFAVETRRREIGLRIAIGAEKGRVVALVLRRSVGLAVAGIVAGLGGALAAGRALERVLFGVAPGDVPTLAAGCAGVLAVTLIASWWPARRAAALDPLVALGSD